MGQADKRTDSRPLHGPRSAYQAAIVTRRRVMQCHSCRDERVTRQGHRVVDDAAKRRRIVAYTQDEVTPQSLWSRYDRHFVGITRHNALS